MEPSHTPDDLEELTSKDEQDLIEKSDLLTDISFDSIDIIDTYFPDTTRVHNAIFKKGFLTYKDETVSCTLMENKFTIQQGIRSICINLSTVFAIQPKNNFFTIYLKDGEKKYLYQLYTHDTKTANEWVYALHSNTFGLSTEIKKRRILVIINPYSGLQKAEEIFNKHARPILDVAHLTYTVYKSKCRDDITSMIRTVDCALYDEFAVVGGDGSVFELIQGMMGRIDWKMMILKPISVLPAGTGNGLAKEVGATSPQEGAFIIARGFYKPLDVVSMLQKGTKYYCAMAASFGIISDVDYETETEFMRKLGSFRYDFSALKKILTYKSYKATIDFVEDTDPKSDLDSWNIYEHPVPRYTGPDSKIVTGPPCSLLEKYFYNDFMELSLKKHTKTTQSEGIRTIHREIVLFCAMNIRNLTDQYLVGPKAHMSDGCVDLVVISKDLGMWDMMVSFLTDFASGEYIKRKEVEYFKVKAFCLRPEEGSIAIDGELVGKPSPLLCEVHKGLLKVMSM